jgi:hypothetical protein
MQYAERLIKINSEAMWSFAVLGRLNAEVFLHSVKPVAACLLSVAAAKQSSLAERNQVKESHRWPTLSNEAKDQIATACMTLEVAGESDKVVRCALPFYIVQLFQLPGLPTATNMVCTAPPPGCVKYTCTHPYTSAGPG